MTHTTNLIATMLDIYKAKSQIENCPADQVVTLCAHWSVVKPSYPDDAEEQESYDLEELEKELGATLIVSCYDDLIADPHGIYTDL